MPKIAIVRYSHHSYYDYYARDVLVAHSITEWTEVSDSDLAILKQYHKELSFDVVERMPDEQAFIAKTVADYKQMAEREQKKAEAEKKRREAEARKKQEAKALQTKKAKQEMLAKLKRELGEE
jgi:hypothetical protein